ncbi:MAG: retroviral-like aspartic protease [Candidatus Latescibacteria bacterium]|nr:retroviral-like aspartic protease [Candidatus Latescibacterota bacterium]
MNQIECGFPIDTALVEYGPYLNVYIGTDTTFYPDSSNQSKGPYRALIDTGASQNCIDKILAQQIGLTPIDEQTSYGASGAFTATIFSGQICLPDLQWEIYGEIVAVDLKAFGNFDILIGRTTLQHCIMTYNGPTGSVLLSRP